MTRTAIGTVCSEEQAAELNRARANQGRTITIRYDQAKKQWRLTAGATGNLYDEFGGPGGVFRAAADKADEAGEDVRIILEGQRAIQQADTLIV